MTRRVPITYGEFYDVPRMIRFELDGQWFFLRSYFSEESDDYSDLYDFYLPPFRTEQEVKAHLNYWMELDKAVHLGQIPVPDVVAALDPARRSTIDTGLVEGWLVSHKAG